MRVVSIEKVLTCISDPWKLRIIAYLDEEPDLDILTKYLEGRYSKGLGVVFAKSGYREIYFYKDGKVTVRLVDSEEDAIKFINSMLSMAYTKALISGEI